MLIHEMTEDECRAALKDMDFGRLACVLGQQPYIVPVHFSYDGGYLYGITRSYPIRPSISTDALTLSRFCRAVPCGGSRLVSPLNDENGVRRFFIGSALNR